MPLTLLFSRYAAVLITPPDIFAMPFFALRCAIAIFHAIRHAVVLYERVSFPDDATPMLFSLLMPFSLRSC